MSLGVVPFYAAQAEREERGGIGRAGEGGAALCYGGSPTNSGLLNSKRGTNKPERQRESERAREHVNSWQCAPSKQFCLCSKLGKKRDKLKQNLCQAVN